MVNIKVTSLEFLVDGVGIHFGFPILSAEVKDTDYWVKRQILATRILRSRGVVFPSDGYGADLKDGYFVYGVNHESMDKKKHFATLPESEVPGVLKEVSFLSPQASGEDYSRFHDSLNAHHSLDFVSELQFGRIFGGIGVVGVSLYVVPTSKIEIDLLER